MDDIQAIQESPAPPAAAEPSPSESANVAKWTEKVTAARKHWEKDFSRMRKDMEFVAGFQWAEQDELDDPRYTNNLTLRAVNLKVSSLYARDPKIKSQRRRRLDFKMWDGRMESIQQAAALHASPEAMPEDKLQSMALLADYAQGRMQRDMVDKVGTTLDHLFSYQLDNQQPSFKKAMKALVRRTVITGVGYVRMNFTRDANKVLAPSVTESTVGDRAAQMYEIGERIQSGQADKDSAEVEELAALAHSLQASTDEADDIQERLVFDFPKSTSVIVDPACTQIKDFVGAQWIAQEYILSISDINQFFGTSLKADGDHKKYSKDGHAPEAGNLSPEGEADSRACVWEVFDVRSKTCFYICDGHRAYLRAPEPIYPKTKHIWPLFALTFNDVEVEPGQQKASIFPPSDVQLLRHPQKEWNRTREALREHRNANKPKYGTGKNVLTDEDKRKLTSCEGNVIVEFEGLQPGQKIADFISPFPHDPVDPTLYDVAPLQQDMFAAIGNEEANQPASSKATATAATINEQSRLVVTASNVDDLDDLLSDIAEAGGEVLLREMSAETVMRIAGPGAIWPETPETKEDFVNYVYLTIVAASSGRPNKALEIANFAQIAPLLLQAGAKPEFIVREAIKRLDDRLDLDEAFPFGPGQAAMAMPLSTQEQQTSNPDASGQPARGQTGAAPEGQMPAGAVPRQRVERPQLNN